MDSEFNLVDSMEGKKVVVRHIKQGYYRNPASIGTLQYRALVFYMIELLVLAVQGSKKKGPYWLWLEK